MTVSGPLNWDVETDLLIGGSGIGGLTAALKGNAEGMNVLVLEKSDRVGGVSAVSGGELWVGNNHLQGPVDVKDSEAEVEAYLRNFAPDEPDPALFETWQNTAPAVLRFLEQEADFDWKLIEGLPDYGYPDAPGSKSEGRYIEVEPIRASDLGQWSDKVIVSPVFPVGITHDEMFEWGGFAAFEDWEFDVLEQRKAEGFLTFGSGVMGYFLRALHQRDIDIYTGTPIEELVVEDGAVTGVVAERNGSRIALRAHRGLMLAIGGYDWNEELIDRYEFVPTDEWTSGSIPTVEGDHMQWARELGAEVFAYTHEARLPGFLPGIHIPGEKMGGEPLHRFLLAETGTPGAIVVNERGERFYNEAYYHDFIAKVGAYDVHEGTYENWPCYVILDHRHRESYPLATIPPGEPLPEGFGASAGTLEELGEKLDIDPDGLEETVRTFNEAARRGHDPSFPRGEMDWQRRFAGDKRHEPHPNIGPLTDPPFYGIRLKAVGFDAPRAGLRVNAEMQVMTRLGDPIPNLYAAGNTVAYLDTGGAYNSGFAMSRGMTHGYVAASHAADR
jgi:3-oxosteroid 1-dehydrogenase